ncbi:MAG: hypothetical protein A2698_00820 [Candidatus Levybacteria bacterium RIFCSPHIGHO2_01_FULL_42_15]|nr:MAG: hypothetical protein A2698_00820 [Candidatus Levybacteria bacterium RIFCSPHIGHO2_01_FULL_42_15]
MNALSTIITFIQENRKNLTSVFLILGILSATLVVVILLQRSQTYLSEAESSEVVFKNFLKEILPTNEKDLIISESLEVIVELHPKEIPQSYKIGETPLELAQAQLKPYENPPITFTYTFKNLQDNVATLLIEFLYSDGTSKKAVSSIQINGSPNYAIEFTSPKGQYKLPYDKRQWTVSTFGSKAIFTLNKEYGAARLDITEGESEKDLESLKNEIVKGSPLAPIAIEAVELNGKPSYLIGYKEEILGEGTYYYQQILKDENKFFIFEKRAPQLGYNQPYLDNLLQGFLFIGEESLPKIKGASTSSTDLTTVQLVDLIRPSVANIVHVYCLEILNLQPSLSSLSKPQYSFCASSKGSGFIVHEEGVVATNGHVAKIYPEEGLVTNLLYEGNKVFSTDLIRGVYVSKGQSPTQNQVEDFYRAINLNPQYLDRFLTEIFRLIQNKIISVGITNEKYYVNVGNEPVKIDYQKIQQGDYVGGIVPSSTTYTARFLDAHYPNRYSYDAIINKNYLRGADIALLQIDNAFNNLFPALELGSIENVREGSEIVVAGYPTLVEGQEDPRSAISYKTSTKPTITRGIISSVKEDVSGKVVLQTDASIDHGNSGGPAFNSLGQVIGIATFAFESQTGNFNFLREISELKELMAKNSIDNKLGKLTDLWRKGLNSFRHQRFGQTIEYFKKVEALSPNHPTIKELMERSENAIAKGESLEGLTGFIKGEGSSILLIVFGSVSMVSFMVAGFLGILPLFIKRRHAF